MKEILTLAAVSFTANVIAQTCVVKDDLVTPTIHIYWTSGSMRTDGGALGLIAPSDNLGDLVVLRTAPDGTVQWSKRLATTDPTARLMGREVLPTADGGALVYGVRRHNQLYTNHFAIKLDANGQEEWARIYMGMESEWFYPWGTVSPRMVVHPSGGYVLSFMSLNGVYVNRLDAQGLPVWTKRYELTSSGFSRLHLVGLVVEPDDEMMLVVQPASSGGAPSAGPLLAHLLPNGDIDWTTRYDVTPDDEEKFIRTANGEFVFFGSNGSVLFRVSSNGAALWITDHTNYFNGELTELSNGDLFLAGDDNYLVNAVRWASDGTVVQGWNPIGGTNNYLRGMIGERNDTLVFTMAVWDTTYSKWEPEILTVPTSATMNCAFTPVAVPASTPALPAVITTDTLGVSTDPVKTWTLALGDAVELTQVDLQCYLTASTARPGFQHHVYAHLTNSLGAPTGPIAATMTIDPQVTIISATPSPTSTVGNTLIWSGLPSMDGFGYNGAALHVITQVPTTATVGAVVTHTITVVPDSVDQAPANNNASVSRTITNAVDPNDKIVWPANVYDMTTDSVLDYTINFQNTGTDTAFTVVVRDTLPVEVSVGSFTAGVASHPYSFQLNAEGVATWTFDNILLPDSNTNEPLSHGLLSFRIRPDAGLPMGTVISNRANIYFDFNAPVQTPDATVVLTMPTLVPMLHADRLLVHPVPVHDLLLVELPSGFTPVRMRMTTVEGREVRSIDLRDMHGRVAFPTEALTPGVYLMIVQDKEGRSATARFVKE